MNLKPVNIAVVDKNTIVKADVLRSEKIGSAVKIKAIPNAKYILAEGENGVAPENITLKRVGKDLFIMLEGTDEDQPQLIIEDYFDNPGELVGKGEDGQWHEYIATDGDDDHEAAFLLDGESSAQALGAGAIASLDGLAVAGTAFSPALLALGALAAIGAAIGIGSIIRHNRGGNDGGDNGDVIPPPPTGPGKPTIGEVEDDVGPITGPIHNGDATDDAQPVFRGGGANPGDTVELIVDDEVVGTAIVGEDGNWEVTPEKPLPEGEHEAVVVITDPEGNASEPSDPIDFVVDLTPPEKPVIGEVEDDVGPVVGPINDGDTTDDALPVFRGENGTPGDTVELIIDDKVVGTAVVGADGKWAVTPENPLAEGQHEAVVVITDPAGNASEPSDPIGFIVDLTAPAKPVIGDVEDDVGPITGPINNGDITDDTQPVFSGGGAVPGETVELIIDDEVVGTAIVGEDGNWEVTPEKPLPEGKHEAVVVITDPAGNASEPSDPIDFVVDLTPPEKPVIGEVEDDVGPVVGPINDGDTTDDTLPVFRGENGTPGDTVELIIDDKVVGTAVVGADGKWAVTPENPLAEGQHNAVVVITDPAGNASEPSDPIGFIVDLTAPEKPVIGDVEDDVGPITGPINDGDVTDDTQPVFSGGGAVPGETVELIIDDEVVGTAIVGEDGNWEVTPEKPLPEGEHEAVVVITDPAGNASEPSDPIGFIVDTTPPAQPTIDTVFDNVGDRTGNLAAGETTDDNTPTFSGTAEENSLVYIIVNEKVVDSVRATETGSWTWEPSPGLANGPYNVRVVAEDQAGLRSESSEDFNFNVQVGGIPTAPAITDVIDDVESHTGTVQQNGTTNDDRPTLVGTGQDGTTVYLYDGANPDPIGSAVVTGGSWTIEFDAPLAQGEHRFRAVAEDATGNRSPETGEWVINIDSVAPGEATDVELWDDFGTPGIIADNGTTDDNTPTYRGKGEAGGTAIIDLGDGTTVRVPVDASGNWSYTPAPALEDGAYTWQVSIEDKAGNVGPASDPIHFIVDTSGNGISISHVVDDEGGIQGNLASGSHTDDTTPTVVGHATPGAIVKVYVDGNLVDSVVADPTTGQWQYTISPALSADGTYQITASENTGTGDGPQTAPFELTLDTRIPTGTLDGIADDVGLVQGDLANPSVTDDTTPTLRGTGVAGDVVFIYDGTTLIDSVTVGPGGNWNYTLPPQNNGTELEMNVVFQSPTGVRSAPSDSWKITIDTEAPTASAVADGLSKDSGVSDADFITNNSGPGSVVTGHLSAALGAGEKVYVSVDGGATWQEALVDGDKWAYVDTQGHSADWTILTRVVDAAGNYTESSQNVVVDQVAPDAPTDVVRSGNDVTVTLPGSNVTAGDSVLVKVGDVSVTHTLTAADIANGNVTLSLPPGGYTDIPVGAAIVDAAGNSSDYRTSDFTSTNNFESVDEFTAIDAGQWVHGMRFSHSPASETNRFEFVKQGSDSNSSLYLRGTAQETGMSGSMFVDFQYGASDINFDFNPNFVGNLTVVSFYDINGNLIDSVNVDEINNNSIYPIAFSSPDKPVYRMEIHHQELTLGRGFGFTVDNLVVSGNAKFVTPGEFLADNQGDIWYGDAADNLYQVSDVASLNNATIQGGEGLDTLKLLGADQQLDLSALGNKIQSMEVIDITGSGNNTLTLRAGEVLENASQNLFHDNGFNQMMVKGDAGDKVNLSDLLPNDIDPGNWTNGGTVNVGGVEYQSFQMDSLNTEILVQMGVTVTLQNH
ncbi:Ig-like domain-containing protein [Enterobacter ludwigii]|uniref:Ig-like domain-containing protein n=1 Tax=Enterobacter ludwigii TaxID=299767 RepID=UPI001A9D0E88|nr:Ig-like domain-containing protein [Enterobacter ludwigii]MBO1470198.1 Ig-like domain repeat protein [Enterobacter ludwigii]MBO1527982.1 Ig-like domain repeat protein [Enterobacter ludwigii]